MRMRLSYSCTPRVGDAAGQTLRRSTADPQEDMVLTVNCLSCSIRGEVSMPVHKRMTRGHCLGKRKLSNTSQVMLSIMTIILDERGYLLNHVPESPAKVLAMPQPSWSYVNNPAPTVHRS